MIGKIKSCIYHDEGKTSFFGRVKKKYYYSKVFRKYVRRYPNIAVSQFFPFKKAYIAHWKELIKNPIITGGMILLRSAEVGAGFEVKVSAGVGVEVSGVLLKVTATSC